MSAAEGMAKVLGEHLFLRSDWPDLKSRCSCGHKYDNPNASEGYSHPLHVADALAAAGYRDVQEAEAADMGNVERLLFGSWRRYAEHLLTLGYPETIRLAEQRGADRVLATVEALAERLRGRREDLPVNGSAQGRAHLQTVIRELNALVAELRGES